MLSCAHFFFQMLMKKKIFNKTNIHPLLNGVLNLNSKPHFDHKRLSMVRTQDYLQGICKGNKTLQVKVVHSLHMQEGSLPGDIELL